MKTSLDPRPSSRIGAQPAFDLRHLVALVLALHLSIQAYGLLYTSSVHTGWIIGFSPVVTALGAQLFLRARMRGIGWVGVTIATGGVLAVTMERPLDLVDATFGDLLQLSSCVHSSSIHGSVFFSVGLQGGGYAIEFVLKVVDRNLGSLHVLGEADLFELLANPY